jgi:hypothetical protein
MLKLEKEGRKAADSDVSADRSEIIICIASSSAYRCNHTFCTI